MKKEAALEKPLLDSIKEIIEHSQKINSGEGYYVEVTAQKCRDLTIAAVKKLQEEINKLSEETDTDSLTAKQQSLHDYIFVHIRKKIDEILGKTK